jgi:Mrp family chromosome partitioning ATPase
MTTLNQALIKAFARQDKGVALPPEPAPPKTASPPAGSRRQPTAAGSREGQGNRRESRANGLPLADAFGVELAAFDKATPRIPPERAFPEAQRTFSALHSADTAHHAPEAVPEAALSAVSDAPVFETPVSEAPVCEDVSPAGYPGLRVDEDGDISWGHGPDRLGTETSMRATPVPVGQWPGTRAPEARARTAGPCPSNCPQPSAFATREATAAEPFETQLAGVAHPPAPVAPPPASVLADEPPWTDARRKQDFRPGWQIDRFSWPRVCRRLIARAAEEWDRLADALVTARDRGQKVLAIAGCRRGEGATTLLLCAARRVAERGVKAVLVDADTVCPQLAKRLGVQPQVGWDETSPEEGKSLDQAVVEATENNLALVANRPIEESGPAGDWSQLASCLETLRDHYEMVLVDLGPLENNEPIGASLSRAAGKHIDAVLLVHNGRLTSQKGLSEVQRNLTQAGINVAGIVENFVAAEE